MTPGTGFHDGFARRISVGFAVLSDETLSCKDLRILARNQGDHTKGATTEPIGVYVDIIPPGGSGDPFGCLPNGRILETTFDSKDNHSIGAVTGDLDGTFEDRVTGTPGFLAFSCTDQAGAFGKTYLIIVAVDIHGDDLSSCGPGDLLLLACTNALADDDDDQSLSARDKLSRSALRVKSP